MGGGGGGEFGRVGWVVALDGDGVGRGLLWVLMGVDGCCMQEWRCNRKERLCSVGAAGESGSCLAFSCRFWRCEVGYMYVQLSCMTQLPVSLCLALVSGRGPELLS